MKLETFDEPFGSKLKPYSSDPGLDVDCLIGIIKSAKASGPTRHVFFVGEDHGNRYDVERRKKLIGFIANNADSWEFPDGVPKVIAERFEELSEKNVYMKEPKAAIGLPDAFKKLHKSDKKAESENLDNLRTGTLLPSDSVSGSSSMCQSRNQWFAYAIMKAIADTWAKPVPVVVVCGEDHERFVREALVNLAKTGYASDAEIVWHFFKAAERTEVPKAEALASFNFSLTGKTPVGYIRHRANDADLKQLAEGVLNSRIQVELVPDSWLLDHENGWALFLADDIEATTLRNTVESSSSGKVFMTITPDTPARVVRFEKTSDLDTKGWR